jgi:hypothetical protein
VQESGEVANWKGFGTFWAQEVLVEIGLPGPQATNLLEPSEGRWWWMRESVGWVSEVRGEYATATVLTDDDSST